MTDNQNPNLPNPNSDQNPDQNRTIPAEAGPRDPDHPGNAGVSGANGGTGRRRRRVPLVPAILAGAALFIVGGLAGGAVGASTVLMSNESGTSQGPGSPGGQQGGGQQGGAGPDGGMPPDGQAGDGQAGDGQGSGDQTDDATSATDDGSEENVALFGMSSLPHAAVLNRED
ncbi:hypothetical protein [Brevibacterium sp. UCMA 11754]|uniref:hypothetical protein n=1 Tax=Brevibacterium sp. UCMA 11754 TaxID=2749198 RepID=UPI001F1B710D|nr:hypothetical protein [Brevibacterium sp. UCMA 11754]MCF2571260.1 hypothetical protein [Brevibacterium sp. UCMA 11754]